MPKWPSELPPIRRGVGRTGALSKRRTICPVRCERARAGRCWSIASLCGCRNLFLADDNIDKETALLEQALAADTAPVVLVANEVGCGIVPEHPLGRRFRDLQGLLNQRIAAQADRVVLVVAGIPLAVKGAL